MKRKLITEEFTIVNTSIINESQYPDWYFDEVEATFIAYGLDEVEVDLILNDPDVVDEIMDAKERGFGPEKTALYLLQQADEKGLVPKEKEVGPSPEDLHGDVTVSHGERAPYKRMGENVNEEQLPGGPEFDEIRMQLGKLGMPMKKANGHITTFMMMADNPTYDRILTIDPREAAQIIVAGNDAGVARKERGEAYYDNKYEFPIEEQGEDHPAGEWQQREADRRWERDHREYDPDEEEFPYDEMDESVGAINEVSLGDMYREMGTWMRLDPQMQRIADESGLTDANSEDLQYLVNGWMDGAYDEDPEVLMSELENIINQL